MAIQLPSSIKRAGPRARADYERVARSRKNALQKTRSYREMLESPARTLGGGGLALLGAGGAGWVDRRVGRIPIGDGGIPVSMGLGIGLAGASLIMGSPMAANAAVGMLAPHVYQYGYAFAAPGEDSTE